VLLWTSAVVKVTTPWGKMSRADLRTVKGRQSADLLTGREIGNG
jgi:hypothetical protein